jgi:hypothetical protein
MSWEIFFGLGALVLAAAVLWAMRRNVTRNRANDRLTEKATHEEYARPETYDRTQKELERQVRP